MMHDFLVELQTEYEQIARCQIGRPEPGLSADELMDTCAKIVEQRKDFHRKTDIILKERLYPVLDNITDITDEDEAELYETAQRLSSYAVRLDPGLALKIYQRLLEWARHKKNDAKIIQYLYWCGITTFFFFRGQNQNSEQDENILEYFLEGASYADRYYSFEDPDTRKYIHRCLGNTSMMYYYVADAKVAMEMEESSFSFWNGILFGGNDLDFPWLSYFLACLNHRHGHMMQGSHTEPDMVTKAELRDILDLSITINKLYKKNINLFSVFGGTRYDFILWEAQFLAGLISFDHLYENIFEKKAEFAPDDFSSDGMYAKIQLNSYLMFYAAKMQKLKDRKNEIIAKVSRDAVENFSRIPMTVSPSNVSEQLQFFAQNLSDVFDPVEQMDFVLKMTTFRHIPTYAHSIMVGKLSVALTRYLIEKNPESFIGCMDIKTADEAIQRADEICGLVDSACLCHDIGKISYISNPFMHTRTLTDEEYAIIKRHPDAGAGMLMRKDENAEDNVFIDVIKGHHKYYDDSSGYPEDFITANSKFKAIIDIIAVANSIDSATDGIGKTHSEPKSADEIISEIHAGAGVRYSPIVANTLNDEAMVAVIKHILDTERKEAYNTAYLHSWGTEENRHE